jgi:hypothetical protein
MCYCGKLTRGQDVTRPLLSSPRRGIEGLQSRVCNIRETEISTEVMLRMSFARHIDCFISWTVYFFHFSLICRLEARVLTICQSKNPFHISQEIYAKTTSPQQKRARKNPFSVIILTPRSRSPSETNSPSTNQGILSMLRSPTLDCLQSPFLWTLSIVRNFNP